jgi:hypothetical protein
MIPILFTIKVVHVLVHNASATARRQRLSSPTFSNGNGIAGGTGRALERSRPMLA